MLICHEPSGADEVPSPPKGWPCGFTNVRATPALDPVQPPPVTLIVVSDGPETGTIESDFGEDATTGAFWIAVITGALVVGVVAGLVAGLAVGGGVTFAVVGVAAGLAGVAAASAVIDSTAAGAVGGGAAVTAAPAGFGASPGGALSTTSGSDLRSSVVAAAVPAHSSTPTKAPAPTTARRDPVIDPMRGSRCVIWRAQRAQRALAALS